MFCSGARRWLAVPTGVRGYASPVPHDLDAARRRDEPQSRSIIATRAVISRAMSPTG